MANLLPPGMRFYSWNFATVLTIPAPVVLRSEEELLICAGPCLVNPITIYIIISPRAAV